MCRPSFFSVEYVINPWMKPGIVDRARAEAQWEHLVREIEGQQIKVEIINQEQHLPDMVFSADQGVVVGNNVLVSNFRYPERRGERIPYLNWFTTNGFATSFIPSEDYFEGTGEAVFWKNILFVGTGFRTSKNSCEKIAEQLNIEVIPLELINPNFYHLDVCLLPLNKDTVFYYPEAFSEDSKKLLNKLVPHLIPFTDAEAHGFSANSLVTDHHVIVQKGNDSFTWKLKELGYTVIEVDVSEFNKAGGGVHCLTGVLAEEYA